MKRIFTIALILSAIFQLAANTAKAQNIYLVYDGVKGSATLTNAPKGTMEVSSAGVTAACSTCTTTSSGPGAGKVTPGKFIFNLKDDKALIDLRNLLYAQKPTTGNVCFAFRKNGGTAPSPSYYYISLGIVRVLEIDEVTTSGGGPTAYQVSLAYGQIQYTYKPQNADGTLGTPVTTGWDYTMNGPLKSPLPIPSGF